MLALVLAVSKETKRGLEPAQRGKHGQVSVLFVYHVGVIVVAIEVDAIEIDIVDA